MHDKDDILNNISARLNALSTPAERRRAASERLKTKPRGIIPKRSAFSSNRLPYLFVEEAKRADATCQSVPSPAEATQAISDYLSQHALPSKIWLSRQASMQDIAWEDMHDLEIQYDFDGSDGLTAINFAYAGIAESGSLVFLSSKDFAMSQNFLNTSHIAILRKRDIVAAYEDIYQRMQEENLSPRSLTMITGPSRTGDIAQTIEIGAHAALRLHILILQSNQTP